MPESTWDRDKCYAVVRVQGESDGHGIMEIVSLHETRVRAVEAYADLPDKRALAVYPRPFNLAPELKRPEPGALYSFDPEKFRDMPRAQNMARALKEAMARTHELSKLEPPKQKL